MIVTDTSALISLASIDLLDTFLAEFDIYTTETVVGELEDTAEYDDRHGRAANDVLETLDAVTVHRVEDGFGSSRVDAGEGSCALLTNELDAAFLITDDLRALPELQNLVDAKVAISPIVLKALIKRDVLERAEAVEKLERLAANRDWLGAPIYRRAQKLFD
jgi:predicted nucleic acid-binding protein